MSRENPTREEQLFIHLVSSYITSAWVSLGKLKNPMTDKIERDLEYASFSLDMLDMIKKRMDGRLEEWEEMVMDQNMTDLKMNFMEEKQKDEDDAKKPKAEDTSTTESNGADDPAEETKE